MACNDLAKLISRQRWYQLIHSLCRPSKKLNLTSSIEGIFKDNQGSVYLRIKCTIRLKVELNDPKPATAALTMTKKI